MAASLDLTLEGRRRRDEGAGRAGHWGKVPAGTDSPRPAVYGPALSAKH